MGVRMMIDVFAWNRITEYPGTEPIIYMVYNLGRCRSVLVNVWTGAVHEEEITDTTPLLSVV